MPGRLLGGRELDAGDNPILLEYTIISIHEVFHYVDDVIVMKSNSKW